MWRGGLTKASQPEDMHLFFSTLLLKLGPLFFCYVSPSSFMATGNPLIRKTAQQLRAIPSGDGGNGEGVPRPTQQECVGVKSKHSQHQGQMCLWKTHKTQTITHNTKFQMFLGQTDTHTMISEQVIQRLTVVRRNVFGCCGRFVINTERDRPNSQTFILDGHEGASVAKNIKYCAPNL